MGNLIHITVHHPGPGAESIETFVPALPRQGDCFEWTDGRTYDVDFVKFCLKKDKSLEIGVYLKALKEPQG